ncbi:MAG: adenylosuccinate lyase [Bacteroidales bacterium]|nr:adenylosuccinate lyase [Bacteroidales bacterium]MCF8346245.1 adenylosuccinate lyase [Bacteroidales bacterium]
MSLQTLMAISPVDGRYRSKVEILESFFSEYALIKYRLHVEVEYFIALVEAGIIQLADFPKSAFEDLRGIYVLFTPEEAEKVKKIEGVTNHDVKAVEYYLKERFKALGMEKYSEFIHFGLTSQDINNTAVPLSLKHAMDQVYYPLMEEVIGSLENLADDWWEIPMLARTHGQPASPTRLGKELRVFTSRLDEQITRLEEIAIPGKFGGATGNMNAHVAAYPEIDWFAFGEELLSDAFGLKRSWPTTQIDHYDNLAAMFHAMSRINSILIDLSRDVWTYISMDYFRQEIKAGEVGSSAMPHKVNPIDFENAEGNLGVANALYEHMASKLPVSRLQRDLTDSTVLRNIGVPIAHSMIAMHSLLKGLKKLRVNEEVLLEDLDNNWAVVAEAIQTILRREGYPRPYETLSELTRKDKKITKETIARFIETLNVSEEVRAELKRINPMNYTGL